MGRDDGSIEGIVEGMRDGTADGNIGRGIVIFADTSTGVNPSVTITFALNIPNS